jgi:hypothetical protein
MMVFCTGSDGHSTIIFAVGFSLDKLSLLWHKYRWWRGGWDDGLG